MVPFGRTCVTCALKVAVMVVCRVVAPCPFSWDCVLTPARFAHGPVAFVKPPAAVIELESVDCRDVLTLPLARALAFSETATVTMSPTRLARRSIASAVNRESGDHRDPGDVGALAPFTVP